jgi:hypothetical protein
METSESMSMRSKREYLQGMRWRFSRAQGRGHKSRLIEELVAFCGYSRRHAIKLLNQRGASRVHKRSGPKRDRYSDESNLERCPWNNRRG